MLLRKSARIAQRSQLCPLGIPKEMGADRFVRLWTPRRQKLAQLKFPFPWIWWFQTALVTMSTHVFWQGFQSIL